MAEAKSICEEIEIAIFSDEELSEEQKNHIQNCEHCRVLLSQIKGLKNDLGILSVTGIKEGEIADAVMQTIKREKTLIPFPKFKITHHLGTAAAVVIILVAALMIRNPSEPVNNVEPDTAKHMVFDNTVNNAVSGENSTDASDEIKARDGNTNDGARIAEYSDQEAETETAEQAPKLMMARPPKSEITEAEEEMFDSGAGVYYDDIQYDSVNAENSLGVEFSKNAPAEMQSIQEAPTVEEECDDAANAILTADTYITETDNKPENEELADDLRYNYVLSESIESNEANAKNDIEFPSEAQSGGGSKGSSGSVMKPVGAGSKYIFSGLALKAGEENFDYNLTLVNQRLKKLYGNGYVISRQKLEDLGIDNDKLLDIAPTVTEDMFDFYKNILDIFE